MANQKQSEPISVYQMLRVIRNRRHPEYREMMERLGERFDPLAFDLRGINCELKELRKSIARS